MLTKHFTVHIKSIELAENGVAFIVNSYMNSSLFVTHVSTDSNRSSKIHLQKKKDGYCLHLLTVDQF